jgi:hypothetical protein
MLNNENKKNIKYEKINETEGSLPSNEANARIPQWSR